MSFSPLTALSPLDGRYALVCNPLRTILSEYGLFYYRLRVEIQWFIMLSEQPDIPEIPPVPLEAKKALQILLDQFSEKEALEIKEIEQETKHDVKAVEYFLKAKMEAIPDLAPFKEFIHFGCTSEDINNLAYALILKDTRHKIIGPKLKQLSQQLAEKAKEYASLPMLSRTHGQAASPTTLGKELANVCMRLRHQITHFYQCEIPGKWNGAVGNYNAQVIAYPNVAWDSLSEAFVSSFKLTWNPFTTQIEPHDGIATFCHSLIRINTILIDFSRDCWGYISLGYFRQKMNPNEVGSSTMPHKINPIDFENAEGNLGISNALLTHFSEKLPISRWQRDLSDSTVLRNIGAAIGHMWVAICALEKGLAKLEVDSNRLSEELDQHWEVLAEALQTVMRRCGIENPYETLKELTRGKTFDATTFQELLTQLPLPDAIRNELRTLTPSTYIGFAEKLVCTRL